MKNIGNISVESSDILWSACEYEQTGKKLILETQSSLSNVIFICVSHSYVKDSEKIMELVLPWTKLPCVCLN